MDAEDGRNGGRAVQARVAASAGRKFFCRIPIAKRRGTVAKAIDSVRRPRAAASPIATDRTPNATGDPRTRLTVVVIGDMQVQLSLKRRGSQSAHRRPTLRPGRGNSAAD